MNKKISLIIISAMILLVIIYIISNKRETSSSIIENSTSTPITLNYKYVNFFDWPPKIEILNDSYSCTKTSTTTEIGINNNKYCRSVISEGAAGSIYNTYTYGFTKEDKFISLSFSTRQPQCINYDNPQQTECLNEVKNIDIDNIVDVFVRNLK